MKVEEGYKCHGNLYHKSTHAADVMQTVHCLMEAAQLEVKCVRREVREVYEGECNSPVIGLLYFGIAHNEEGRYMTKLLG